jgi:DNA-binding LacI/PurR family transcriptional regulator
MHYDAVMRKRPATMHDVARRARVNQSTVSRVLSDTRTAAISAAVRERVLAAARSLDYHRNLSAVALRTGSTRTIMVAVSDIGDSYYSDIIGGIQETLDGAKYSLVLHSLAHAGPPTSLPLLMRRIRFDGALLLGALPSMSDADILELRKAGPRVVLIGRSFEGNSVSSVTAANREGGRLVAEHLIGLGHRQIAVMKGPRGWPDINQRALGLQEAARIADAVEVKAFPCRSWTPQSGYETMLQVLDAWTPTAILCVNDATAVGAMRALRERGKSIPQNVSVVGFDDTEGAGYSCPPLTTVRQPRKEMGREGASELLRLLATARGRKGEPRATVLDVGLVVRGSTCPKQ